MTDQELTSKELDSQKSGDLSDNRTVQMPLTKLLRTIPEDSRLTVCNGENITYNILIGKYCHEAAEQLTTTQKALDSAVEALKSIIHDDVIDNCDCKFFCQREPGHSVNCPIYIAEAALASISGKEGE